jgi:O-glycosyl hydrolase
MTRMRDRLLWAAALFLPVAGCGRGAAVADVSVAVNPAVTYQTMMGWGKTTPWLPASGPLHDLALDRAVNDLGLNRLRFEGFCGNKTSGQSWEWLNDNDDPHTINWAGFGLAQLDARAAAWLVPWKKAVEARGEPFDLYVSPSFFRGGSSGELPPWMLADPEEYAEWALALLLRLRDQHGITADYYSICNEAGNGNAFSPAVVARMMKALVPRLRQQGFPTVVQFPECVNAQVSWQYVEALRNDPQIWDWIGLISYHWYGQDNQSWMVKLRDFARERNLPTAQTEFMDLTIDHLYDDLVLGGVSYWEVYGLATPDYEAGLSHVSSTSFSGGPWYWHFRQVLHYVRPGAVRVEASSSDPAVRALAFKADGAATVVLINTTPPPTERTVALSGLPSGLYGTCRSVGQNAYEELGTARVGDDGALTVTLPPNCVFTAYPRSPANQPPTLTQWRSRPDFLTLPASSVELVCGATDPERDALSAIWTVVTQPDGAKVSLADRDAMSTRANGLSVPGDYAFAVRVSDGAHEVARELQLRVFDGNQPPVPMDVHNRIPVWVTVKDGGTLLRAGAWDVERDPVTFRWSVVSQPPGAAATLETADKPGCRVTGMSVPGDYVFRVAVSDPTHTVAVDHTVPVYP